MKVALINFSGNVGKSTLAHHLLAPRLRAPIISVESVNADSAQAKGGECLRGNQFALLQERWLALPDAVIDVGASNAESFIKQMAQYHGSQEDIDLFIVPTASEKKQQADTLSTIRTLSGLGIPATRIKLVFNKVDPDDAGDMEAAFSALYGFHALEKSFTLLPHAVLFANDVFERLHTLGTDLDCVVSDTTDYHAVLREGGDAAIRLQAVNRILIKRLAVSAQSNLDALYRVLFGKGGKP